MDRKTKTLRERVLEHVAVLRIPLTADELDDVLSTTERESLSLLESLDRLLGEQAARRRDRGISRRITAAHFAEHKTLDTFDWTFNKGDQMAAELDYVALPAKVKEMVRASWKNEIKSASGQPLFKM